MIRVGTFVDLPEKAFPQDTVQNHIFPGDAILWACTGGESRGLTPGNLSVHRLQCQVLLRCNQTPGNTSAKNQGLGWAEQGALVRSIVSDPGKSHRPIPSESWSHVHTLRLSTGT